MEMMFLRPSYFLISQQVMQEESKTGLEQQSFVVTCLRTQHVDTSAPKCVHKFDRLASESL